VYIHAEVPYCWTESLGDDQTWLFSHHLLARGGIELRYGSAERMEPIIANGKMTGQMTIVEMTIHGIEAIRFESLVAMVAALRCIEFARIIEARYLDLDDGVGEWESIV
jgi:hypothetical protein